MIQGRTGSTPGMNMRCVPESAHPLNRYSHHANDNDDDDAHTHASVC